MLQIHQEFLTCIVASVPGGAIILAYDAMQAKNRPKVKPFESSTGKNHHGFVITEYSTNRTPDANSTNDIV